MKKRVIILLIVLSFFCHLSFSDDIENFYFWGGGEYEPSFKFDKETLTALPFMVNLPEQIEASYIYSIINEAYYFTINSDPIIKGIILYNGEFGCISIYDPVEAESGLMIRMDSPNRIQTHRHEPFTSFYDLLIRASSFLKENSINYVGENLNMSIKDGPWVEGVPGDGIGEYVEFDYTNTYIKEINGIVISNGFVSSNNPDLYAKNNRIKKILVEANDGKFINEYDILDTPNLQTIRFGENLSKIKITILDVYKGTDWDDTCINMIIGIKL